MGKSGKRLKATLKDIGFNSDNVYMTNTVKCRPPDNREPKASELEACSSFLLEQLRILDPWVIVALGKTSVQAILHTNQALASMRGRVFRLIQKFDVEGKEVTKVTPVFATYHPSFILRNPSATEQWEADLMNVLKVLNKMELAID